MSVKRHAFRILLCLVLGAVTTVAVAWGCAMFVDLSDSSVGSRRYGSSSRTDGWIVGEVSGFGSRRRLGVWCVDWGESQQLVEYFKYVGCREDANALADWPPIDGPILRHDFASYPVVKGPPKPPSPPLPSDFRVSRSTSSDRLPTPTLVGEERRGDDARGWPLLALERPFDCGGFYQRLQPFSERASAGVPQAFHVRMPWATSDAVAGHATAVLPLRPIWSGLIVDTLVHAAMWSVLLFGFGTTRRAIRRRRGRCTACGYDLRGAAHHVCPECGAPKVETRRDTETHRESVQSP